MLCAHNLARTGCSKKRYETPDSKLFRTPFYWNTLYIDAITNIDIFFVVAPVFVNPPRNTTVYPGWLSHINWTVQANPAAEIVWAKESLNWGFNDTLGDY